ncbi:MAG: hypothetical protein OXK80_01815 [Bdellovibrionales bacterium]|nr:hypothetical protein [Bdellovibrionales bacterium]
METIQNNWVKTLVHQEEQMEKTGKISTTNPFVPSKVDLQEHTVEFLKQLRTAFTQHISFFNQLKGYMGSIRIYGITGTTADFMLFRNGYKMIFSMKEAGWISIRFSNMDAALPGQEEQNRPSDYLKGAWGAFGELKWTHQGKDIRMDYLIRYYMTHFVKQSLR